MRKILCIAAALAAVVALAAPDAFAQTGAEATEDAGEPAGSGEAEEGEAAPAVEVEAAPAEETAAEDEGGGSVSAEASLETEAAPKKSVWRNTLFVYENAVSAYSFSKEAELTYNPYYAMSYRFAPRFYLYEGLSLRLDWSLEQELTNSDTTTKKHEPYWSDVLVDLVWGGLATIPKAEIAFTPKIRFTLPASKGSQARTLYVAIGPGFDFLKTFDVLGGITLQWAFRYTKHFNKYSGSVSEEPLLECPGTQASCPYYAMGPRNPSHTFSNSFLFEIRPIDALYFDIQVAVVNNILYRTSPKTVEVIGGSYTVEESSKNTNHSGLMQYVFELGYDVLPFMTIALGTNTYNPMLAPNSRYYAPFFNRYTNIYLDFVLYPEVIASNVINRKKGKLSKDFY